MWLANGYKVKRTADGTAVAIEDVEGLTHAICQALARKVDVSTPLSSATCAPLACWRLRRARLRGVDPRPRAAPAPTSAGQRSARDRAASRAQSSAPACSHSARDSSR
jgi:hypothetical protein